MSYNFSRGVQFIGDISGSEDPDRNTGIDFEDNIIRMVADGGRTLVVNHDKVGIGVDSPSHKFDINGDIRIRGNDIRDNSGNPAITFDGSANTRIKNDLEVVGSADVSGSLYVTGSLSAEDFMIVAVTEENTNIQTGAEQMVLLAPFDIELTHTPRAFISSPSTSGVITVDINKQGSSIFSTNLTIDANEGSSATAATAAVLSTSEIDDGDKITFDVDTAGTSAKGLKVTLYYRRRLH